MTVPAARRAAAASGAHADDGPYVTGAAVMYRLFDIGYAIALEQVDALLAPDGPARARPARDEAQALQIANPPVTIALGQREFAVDDTRCTAELSARLFDFGVCSLQLEVVGGKRLPWSAFARLARALDRSMDIEALFLAELDTLRTRIAPAVERAGLAPVHEDYIVFRVVELHDGVDGALTSSVVLTDEQLAALLLGELRPLAPSALRELLQHRFSYYADDLVILTWDNAFVLEPATSDRDVEYMLEFANAQLLELRVYDSVLDAELPQMYARITEARRRRRPLPTRRFQDVLAKLQTRVADVTEIVERAENALKVTEDVYLARIYGRALDLFLATAWRRGIERKLEIFRSTYSMLNGEAQAARTELLELLVILIIAAEFVVALVRH